LAITKRNYVPGENEIIAQVSAGVVTFNQSQYFMLEGYWKFSISDIQVYYGAGKDLVPALDYELIVDDKYTDLESSYTGKTLHSKIKFTNVLYDGEEFFITGLNYGAYTDLEDTKRYIDETTVSSTGVNWIDFIPQALQPAFLEGRIWFDEFSQTIKVHNDLGIDMQFGRTISSRFTAEEDILKGECLFASKLVGPLAFGVKKAAADTYNENFVFGLAANDALTGEICEFMQQGFIIGVDTSVYEVDKILYMDVVRGKLTTDRPDFPAEPIIIGAVVFYDAVTGVIGVNENRDPYNHGLDGTIPERHEFDIVPDSGFVYADVSNLDPTRDLVIQLGSEKHVIDTTTSGPDRIPLLLGTSGMPMKQTVYYDLTGSVPVLKTTAGFPAQPFCEVGKCSIRDFVSEDTYGQLGFRRTTSATQHDGRGIIARILERLSIMPPKYTAGNGIIPTATIDQGPTPDSMNLSVISGMVWQTLLQDFPSLSVDTDGIFVANGPGGAGLNKYDYFTDLTDVLGWTAKDESRVTSCTGSIVPFAVVNKSTSQCKFMVNLPNGLQASTTNGGKITYDNTDNDAIFTAPAELDYVSFSLCRIPYRFTSGGNTVEFLLPDGTATTDGSYIISLLGQDMGISGGGVGGGAAGLQNLSQVLTEGNDAGNVQIKNIANGTLNTDASNVGQSFQVDGSSTMDGDVDVGDNDILNAKSLTIGAIVSGRPLEISISGVSDSIMAQTYAKMSTPAGTEGVQFGGDATGAMIGSAQSNKSLHLLARKTGVYTKALTVDLDAMVTAPAMTNEQINNHATDDVLTTRGYVNKRTFILAVGETLTITALSSTLGYENNSFTAMISRVPFYGAGISLWSFSAGGYPTINDMTGLTIPDLTPSVIAAPDGGILLAYGVGGLHPMQITIEGVGDSKISDLDWVITT